MAAWRGPVRKEMCEVLQRRCFEPSRHWRISMEFSRKKERALKAKGTAQRKSKARIYILILLKELQVWQVSREHRVEMMAWEQMERDR